MQSFRTELENPIVERDILELERKIHEFRDGKIPEEKFRSSSLGPRVCMASVSQEFKWFASNYPTVRMTLAQWKRIADVSD